MSSHSISSDLTLSKVEGSSPIIDSHAHIQFQAFNADRSEVIKRTLEEGVWMINVGTRYDTSKAAVELAHKYEGLFATVGIHPIHVVKPRFIDPQELPPGASESEEIDWEKFEALAHDPKVVAIGECGLDYWKFDASKRLSVKPVFDSEVALFESLRAPQSLEWQTRGELVERLDEKLPDEASRLKEKQKEIFLKQLEIARTLGKPVAFHCRAAYDDLYEILKAQSGVQGVVHFFTGSYQAGKKFLELGFFLAFPGVITYARDYDKIIRETPLEQLLIETDAPYATPEPYRGQRNEPRYVKFVAKKISEIKGISVEEVIKTTTQNAKTLFHINP